MKKYILFDHDGVLVDTEFWYFRAGERALADIGFTLDRDQYLRDMTQGMATWAQAIAAGNDEQIINRQRDVRNVYYQEYLRTEDIEIDGVLETLDVLADQYRMGIITTSKPVDFALIQKAIHPGLYGILFGKGWLRASETTSGTLSERTPTF